jgi:hypothetical protein
MYPTAKELAALLAPFDPERDELLRLLSRRIDDGMLREIAEADYGLDADAHEAALRRIRDQGEIPFPMEVLQLTRWWEPDDPDYDCGSKGERGHRVRAFAAAALLRAGAEPANADFISGENETLAQLLASAAVLGPDVEEAALRFLAWRSIHFSDREHERPFFALALLLTAGAVGWFRRGDGFFLDQLIDWVHAEERQARDHTGGLLPNHGGPWVLGLTVYNQRHDTWRALARRLLAQAESAPSEWNRERLVEAGTWLLVPG